MIPPRPPPVFQPVMAGGKHATFQPPPTSFTGSSIRPSNDLPSLPIDSVTSVAGSGRRVKRDSISTVSGSVGSVVSGKRGKEESGDEDVPEDLQLKRKRNTEAARRSREKKNMKIADLENFCKRVEAHNTSLTVKVAVLENEKLSLLSRQRDLLARIAQLETQLQEAHRGLVALNNAGGSGGGSGVDG
ncbi:hypothetical protein HDU67_004729 [Dinochytrium kinnereticum]|nr:hypothetical protein HDU67_004729 [Dinochytrium kinnereticum]